VTQESVAVLVGQLAQSSLPDGEFVARVRAALDAMEAGTDGALLDEPRGESALALGKVPAAAGRRGAGRRSRRRGK
jgi:hypothetical protein